MHTMVRDGLAQRPLTLSDLSLTSAEVRGFAARPNRFRKSLLERPSIQPVVMLPFASE
jgi:hypothetical protein